MRTAQLSWRHLGVVLALAALGCAEEPTYDVVLANLFSTVHIEAWPVIAKSLAPGGDLIVSGILASQAWDVFTAAAGSGLGFTQVVRKGKWVTARGGHMVDLIAAEGE